MSNHKAEMTTDDQSPDFDKPTVEREQSVSPTSADAPVGTGPKSHGPKQRTGSFLWLAALVATVGLVVGVVSSHAVMRDSNHTELPNLDTSSNYVASSRAIEMYSLISEGRFGDAYNYRSAGCKKLSKDDYINAMKQQPKIESPRSARITFSPDNKYAYIGTNSGNGTFGPGLTVRRWVIENGEWKFDNCE